MGAPPSLGALIADFCDGRKRISKCERPQLVDVHMSMGHYFDFDPKNVLRILDKRKHVRPIVA